METRKDEPSHDDPKISTDFARLEHHKLQSSRGRAGPSTRKPTRESSDRPKISTARTVTSAAEDEVSINSDRQALTSFPLSPSNCIQDEQQWPVSEVRDRDLAARAANSMAPARAAPVPKPKPLPAVAAAKAATPLAAKPKPPMTTTGTLSAPKAAINAMAKPNAPAADNYSIPAATADNSSIYMVSTVNTPQMEATGSKPEIKTRPRPKPKPKPKSKPKLTQTVAQIEERIGEEGEEVRRADDAAAKEEAQTNATEKTERTGPVEKAELRIRDFARTVEDEAHRSAAEDQQKAFHASPVPRRYDSTAKTIIETRSAVPSRIRPTSVRSLEKQAHHQEGQEEQRAIAETHNGSPRPWKSKISRGGATSSRMAQLQARFSQEDKLLVSPTNAAYNRNIVAACTVKPHPDSVVDLSSQISSVNAFAAVLEAELMAGLRETKIHVPKLEEYEAVAVVDFAFLNERTKHVQVQVFYKNPNRTVTTTLCAKELLKREAGHATESVHSTLTSIDKLVRLGQDSGKRGELVTTLREWMVRVLHLTPGKVKGTKLLDVIRKIDFSNFLLVLSTPTTYCDLAKVLIRKAAVGNDCILPQAAADNLAFALTSERVAASILPLIRNELSITGQHHGKQRLRIVVFSEGNVDGLVVVVQQYELSDDFTRMSEVRVDQFATVEAAVYAAVPLPPSPSTPVGIAASGELGYLKQLQKLIGQVDRPTNIPDLSPSSMYVSPGDIVPTEEDAIEFRVKDMTYGIASTLQRNGDNSEPYNFFAEKYRKYQTYDDILKTDIIPGVFWKYVTAGDSVQVGHREENTFHAIYPNQTSVSFSVYCTKAKDPVMANDRGVIRLGVSESVPIPAELSQRNASSTYPIACEILFGEKELQLRLKHRDQKQPTVCTCEYPS